MITDGNEWIMQGIPEDDERCIHTADELERRIEQAGFLPLFAGEIPGFSVEENTAPQQWWTGDEETDPWEWRGVIARRGRIAYGKFFDGKAGFLSPEWFPVFANYRRDGYDFDARWDDELAGFREKKIMDLFLGKKGDRELFSYQIRQEAGFYKGGEKNFEGTLTALQMQTYLVCRDFRQRINKKGQTYGWHAAVLCTPEHLFGTELVRKNYREDPEASFQKIVGQVKKLFPGATDAQILKTAGTVAERARLRTKVKYGSSGHNSL